MSKLLLAVFLVACATESPTPERGAVSEEGKADAPSVGSCATSCGEKSPGTCYCDDQCASFHDCCEDAAPVCGVESNRLENRTAGMQPLAQLEVFATLPYPPGNVASANGRVFISFFPDGNQGDFDIAEIVNGKPVAFPADLSIHRGLIAVLGIRADNKGRLWLLDHGQIGIFPPKLVAIDIATQNVVVSYELPGAVAGLGSLLNDLVISPDGDFVYISDLSPIAHAPAIVVVDLRGATPVAHRRLERHASVVNGPYDTFVDGREMKIKGIRPTQGIDGIALDRTGAQLYYAALNGGTLYRVSTDALRAGTANPVKVADITQTDGMIADDQGRIYLTDMEHSTVARVKTDGTLEVVARDSRLRWPDGFAWASDGSLLVTASALHTFLPKLIVTSSHIASNAPYHLFRLRL